MKPKTMGLAWIVVSDFKKALQFYTEIVGLKLMEVNEQYGWAELEAQEGGARIGIAQSCAESPDSSKPGQNAVLTFTVSNIEEAVASLVKKGAQLVGSIQEVPGHVKMQTIKDADGNQFQFCELIAQKHKCCHC